MLPDPQIPAAGLAGLGGGGNEFTVATTGVVDRVDSQPVDSLKELT